MNTSDISTPKEILNQFVNSIKILTNSRNCLHLNISTFLCLALKIQIFVM